MNVLSLEFLDLSHQVKLLCMFLTPLFCLSRDCTGRLSSRTWGEELLMVLDDEISNLSFHLENLLGCSLVGEDLAAVSCWLIRELQHGDLSAS